MKQRVRLAPLAAADAAEFIAAARRSRRLHDPWVAPPASPDTFAAMVIRLGAPPNRGFLVRRVDDDALVGAIEITNIVLGPFRSAYLGYFAFAGHERQGLMREALKLMLRLAFGQIGLHRLEANIQPGNHASIALVRACGFEREGYSPRYLKLRGRWRDHERWAIRSD
jgi:[ribosomal protein S5]-alanine N-acetyltransferase